MTTSALFHYKKTGTMWSSSPTNIFMLKNVSRETFLSTGIIKNHAHQHQQNKNSRNPLIKPFTLSPRCASL